MKRNHFPKKHSFHSDTVLGVFIGVFILVLTSFLVAYGDGMTHTAVVTGCTQEARVCPNGSTSVRTGLQCAFSPCPTADLPPHPGIVDEPFEVPNPSITTPPKKGINDKKISCTQEVKICPHGSYVGRIQPRCDFAICPTDILEGE